MRDDNLICGRCGSVIEDVWLNVQLFDHPNAENHGQFTAEAGPEIVCCKCGDEIVPVLERCDFNCLDCPAVLKWGINARSCLNLQNELGLISDEDLRDLEFIKHWQLVRRRKSITATIHSIKNDIAQRNRLRL